MTASRTPSSTPRTDAFYADRFKAPDAIDFARQLETELAAALARAESAEKDAAMFRYLQNLPKAEAQAFFWNYDSRKQRKEAIQAALQEPK